MPKNKIVPEEETSLVPVVKPVKELSFSNNFDKIAETLKNELKKYKGLKITDANFTEAMQVKKMCTSTRTMLDSAQKDAIRLFIRAPEAMLKKDFAVLLDLVASVEKGLDEQLDAFEEERRLELTEVFNGYIDKLQEEYQLPEKYKKAVELKKVYFNKTTKESVVREDLRAQFEEQAKAAKDRQADEDLIRATCAGDKRINPEHWIKQLDYGTSASTIVRDIADEKVRLSTVEAPDPDAMKIGEPLKASVKEALKKGGKKKKVTVELEYDESFGKTLTNFLTANGVKYKILK